jgi:hypothetical protein
MILQKNNSQLLWTELDDSASEVINGGRRFKRFTINVIVQNNIAIVIGNIKGGLNINQGTSAQT